MSSTDFPILFTVNGPKRHEVLITSTTASLKQLSAQIENLITDSPNSQEFMVKYKKAGPKERVTEIKVRWSAQGRDPKWWPHSTVVTEDNIDAVLSLVERSGVGKDLLEVTMAASDGNA
jgi:hypothetical protein